MYARRRSQVNRQEVTDTSTNSGGIWVIKMEHPQTGRRDFAQTFSNGDGHPRYVSCSDGDYTPLPPDYFEKH